jgi:hypothetical protein
MREVVNLFPVRATISEIIDMRLAFDELLDELGLAHTPLAIDDQEMWIR